MAKNTGVLGVAAILLIASAQNGRPLPLRNIGAPLPLLKTFELGGVLHELHKVAEVVNRMDNLGQMVLHAPSPAQLPPAESIAKALPDLSGLMENIGPIMSALNSSQTGDND